MSSDQYSSVPSGNYGAASKPVAASEHEPRIEYFATFNYFFEHPEWLNSLLMGSVCMLIPVLNTILIAGYRYEIVELKVRFPDQLYPKFDFARFSQYLTRGIWPFLIDIIVQMVLVVPILVVFYGSMLAIGITLANNERAGIILMAVVVPLVMFLLIAVSILVSTVMVPLYLRAGLTQDFGQTLKFAWIKDFLAKVWFPTLLFNLFLMVAGGMLVLLGEMACMIGVFPAVFLLAGPILGHAHYQLYRLYLARGGEPIPFKPMQLGAMPISPPAGNAPHGQPLV